MSTKKSTESYIRGVKRNTRRRFTDEEKIRIVVDGLRGEESIAEICRREGIDDPPIFRTGLVLF